MALKVKVHNLWVFVLLLLMTSPVLAELGDAEDMASGHHIRRHTFSAESYFSPIRDGEDRSSFPHQLNLDHYEVHDEEKLKSMLLGRWRLVFHCDGKAIPLHRFKQANISDGVVNKGIQFVYRQKGDRYQLQRVILPSENEWKELQVGESLRPINDLAVYVFLEPKTSGTIKIKYGARFLDQEYRLIRVRETGEILLEQKETGKVDPRNRICPDKTMPRTLLVPLAVS